MGFSVKTDKDTGFKEFFATFKELGQVKAKVGIQGSKAREYHPPKKSKKTRKVSVSKEPITNVKLATIHEFGEPKVNIPERSFIRSTSDKMNRKINKAIENATIRALQKRSRAMIRGELLLIAEGLRAAILKRLQANQIAPFKPLKKKTVDRKGGDKTKLVDTGVLAGAITAVVIDDPIEKAIKSAT